MKQAKVYNGNLHIIFNDKIENQFAIVYKLDNGAELEFVDNELVALILPNFEQQLGIGSLAEIPIDLKNIKMDNNLILFTLDIQGQNINGRIDCTSIKQ